MAATTFTCHREQRTPLQVTVFRELATAIGENRSADVQRLGQKIADGIPCSNDVAGDVADVLTLFAFVDVDEAALRLDPEALELSDDRLASFLAGESMTVLERERHAATVAEQGGIQHGYCLTVSWPNDLRLSWSVVEIEGVGEVHPDWVAFASSSAEVLRALRERRKDAVLVVLGEARSELDSTVLNSVLESF